MAVLETDGGDLVAEVIVEVGEDHYTALAVDAWESGFVSSAAEAPVITGVVEVREGRFERLVLVGGRQVWEPQPAVRATPGWLSAAAAGGALVTVVPPGTWPVDLGVLPPEHRAEVFEDSLTAARESGEVLQSVAAVELA
ncbi:hypothetical protein [Kitasatospora sp. NPDC093679]|uniref:hypothetical protein n=1 Tax=Kitasatospora sp. NPDC093679 TaxID=3154983 RepID=UPI00342745B4